MVKIAKRHFNKNSYEEGENIMALIKCPDCGKEFSDKASACPNCGRPNLNQTAENYNQSQWNSTVPNPQSNKPQTPVVKKNSGLSIAALVFSIMGCTFIIGVILAIVDLCKKDTSKKHGLSIASLVICGVWLVLSLVFDSTNNTEKATNTIETASAQQEETIEKTSESLSTVETVEPEKSIEYIPVTATELSDALTGNALKAKETYAGHYLEITGELGNVDSNGKYIDIDTNDFSLTIIQCYIKNDEQKAVIMEKSKGDSIMVRGYCKDVGEIMGYSIDIESVE